jgi:hypothetical protein
MESRIDQKRSFRKCSSVGRPGMNLVCPQRLLRCMEFEYVPQLNVPGEFNCGSQVPPLYHEALLELIGLRTVELLTFPH